MADSQSERMHQQEPAPALIADDPVHRRLREAQLAYQGMPGDLVHRSLHEAELAYHEARARARFQSAALKDMQDELARVQQQKEQAQDRLARAEAERRDAQEQVARAEERIARQREEAKRQKERADQLAATLKDIHGALFNGNIYEMILKSCLTLTGGTRGLYVTASGGDGALRVRAADGVDGYPQVPLSPYMAALCRKALGGDDTYVRNESDEKVDLPHPASPDEAFRNVIVAPVVLLKNVDGVMIVADKQEGDFEPGDAESILSVGDQGAVAVENVQLRRALQKAYVGTVSALADAMEAKDAYTQGHCDQVARLARLTVERLGLSEYERSIITYAALLHDVGKIGVSDGILNKPGPLLPEERLLMHAHVRVGRDLIGHVPALTAVAEAVLHHHEWYDGTGYPDGLAGERIPIASRIVGAVDAYSAMITERSYKKAYSEARARDELTHCAGTQFDPRVVAALLEVLATPEAYETKDEEEDDEDLLLPSFAHIEAFEHAAHAN